MPALNRAGFIEISDSSTVPALDEFMYVPPRLVITAPATARPTSKGETTLLRRDVRMKAENQGRRGMSELSSSTRPALPFGPPSPPSHLLKD